MRRLSIAIFESSAVTRDGLSACLIMESGLKVNNIPQQPIHPSVIPKLDPEYLQFHNEHLQYITPPHTLPWDPSLRNAPAVPGSSEPLVVGKTQDYDLPNTKFRSFTPEGAAPSAQGWPVLIYFHGGEIRYLFPS